MRRKQQQRQSQQPQQQKKKGSWNGEGGVWVCERSRRGCMGVESIVGLCMGVKVNV